MKWWYVYGPGRSGTTYITRLISFASRRMISDWGLAFILSHLDKVYRIDKERYLADVARNVLDNAPKGKGTQLDFVLKQANSPYEEYKQLEKMFGEPERRIFSLREPAGYIASAIKKFPEMSKERLISGYIANLARYSQIGGDIIEYGPSLVLDDYIKFLEPLKLRDIVEFKYQGEASPELVSREMQSSYDELKRRYLPTGFCYIEHHEKRN